MDRYATGRNDGSDEENAWTDLSHLDRDSGEVSAGDLVSIKGGGTSWDNAVVYVGGIGPGQGTMPNGLKGGYGAGGVWTRYIFTNGLIHVIGGFGILLGQGGVYINGGNPDGGGIYVGLVTGGSIGGYGTNIISVYDNPLVTNNINLWLDQSTNMWNGGSQSRCLNFLDQPSSVRWIRITDAPDTDSGPTCSPVRYGYDGPTTTTNEACYLDIDYASGRGSTGFFQTAATDGDRMGNFLWHHNWLHGINGADYVNNGAGADFYNNLIEGRLPTYDRGCDDGFVNPNMNRVRYCNNVFLIPDNMLIYVWGYQSFSKWYFCGNVIHQVPTAEQPALSPPWTSSGKFEQDAEAGTITASSDFLIANNTWIATTNYGQGTLISFYNREDKNSGVKINDGAMHIVNNLAVEIDTNNCGTTFSPFTLTPGTNQYGQTFAYTAAGIELDYNLFASYVAGNLVAAYWQVAGTSPQALTSASDITANTPYSHNVSSTTFRFANAWGLDFRPVSAEHRIGKDLSAYTNDCPYLLWDVYGKPRRFGANASVGAVENQSDLLLHLTFAQDDGWTTNHVITDKSGWTNNAVYFPSATHETWPTWTNGPGNLDAAYFVTNRINGGFSYGTFAGITNLYGLKWLTNTTFALWAKLDRASIGNDYDEQFLTTGQESNNWCFGDYYSNGPQFSRVSTTGGQEPMETAARWANGPSGWHHYAVTLDNNGLSAYFDGQAWSYSQSRSYTNGNSFVLTNNFSGPLVATNSLGGSYNWLSLGVNSHSGTPNPDDADALPNNGQFCGSLADVRIYNRALSAAEIGVIYSATNGGGSNPTPPASNARTFRAQSARFNSIHFQP